ncbi:META and DUF4377 domain-containing protein [Melaminivora sp.]|uniref:META and DUF4377 domain-containing protein n=1 Tax=Melaminivora sp. TaxID=1933032 RepID=UPI0028AF6B50|nr:META and DUF4377 domain-containing protein [Melaminivora sp.]
MHTTLALKTLSVAGLAALMTACASGPRDAAPPAPVSMSGTVVGQAQAPSATVLPAMAPQLTTHDWEMVAMADTQGRSDTRWRVPGEQPPRLHFEDGRVSVQNLCNAISSSYQLQGQNLTLTQGVSTRRACPNSTWMDLETRMARQLQGTASYEVRSNAGGPALLVLHFADGSRWELTGTPTAQTRYGSAGQRMFLEVAPDRMACNHGVVANAQCLKVREIYYDNNGVRQSEGPWQPLYGEIEGFRHESGMRNIVRVNRFDRPQPVPADASAQAYVLDMVVESERVR